MNNSIKVIFTGDSGVGKSSICERIYLQVFRESYTPTICDTYKRIYTCNNKTYNLSIIDIGANVTVNVDNRTTIVRCFACNTPIPIVNNPRILLCATKCDFEHLPFDGSIVETSAKNDVGIDTLVVKIIIEHTNMLEKLSKRKRNTCEII